MKARKIIFVISTTFLCVGLRFFCGVFQHDEFGHDVYFIKHTPTWKWRFYSPRGMGDLELPEMTAQQREEQILFDKFVSNRITR